jgi:predicted metal-binding protein
MPISGLAFLINVPIGALARTATTWDLVPGLLIAGVGVGACVGRLFRFILSSVSMAEVGSACWFSGCRCSRVQGVRNESGAVQPVRRPGGS